MPLNELFALQLRENLLGRPDVHGLDSVTFLNPFHSHIDASQLRGTDSIRIFVFVVSVCDALHFILARSAFLHPRKIEPLSRSRNIQSLAEWNCIHRDSLLLIIEDDVLVSDGFHFFSHLNPPDSSIAITARTCLLDRGFKCQILAFSSAGKRTQSIASPHRLSCSASSIPA